MPQLWPRDYDRRKKMMPSDDPSATLSSQTRILIITLEFLGPIFSGNGQYCRSIVRALKLHGCRVFVVSGRKASVPLEEQDAEARAHVSNPAHGTFDVPLSTWQRLDRESSWHELMKGAGSDACATSVRKFAPHAALLVDWTALPAWLALRAKLQEPDSPAVIPALYLNFRVFTSSFPSPPSVAGTSSPPHLPDLLQTCTDGGPAGDGADAADSAAHGVIQRLASRFTALGVLTDRQFYAAMEGTTVRACARTIALCRQDACVLTSLACGVDCQMTTNATKGPAELESEADEAQPLWAETCPLSRAGEAWACGLVAHSSRALCIVMPPLRADILSLASPSQGLSTAAETREVAGGAAGAASTGAIPFSIGTAPGCTHITCAVRLSSEKGPHRFGPLLRALEAARPGVLRTLQLQPLVCGNGPDAGYVQSVLHSIHSIPAPAPPPIHCSAFLGPAAMAAVYRATALNVHPALADAYGMTVVEAAAFGVPTLVHVPAPQPPASLLDGGRLPVPAVHVFSRDEAGTRPGYMQVDLAPLLRAATASASLSPRSPSLALALARETLCTGRTLPPVGCCDLLAPEPHGTDAGVVALDFSAPVEAQAASLLPWLDSLHTAEGEGVAAGTSLCAVGARARGRALAWSEEENGAALLHVIRETLRQD